MGRRPSPGSLASLSIASLQSEIRRRQRSLPTLMRQRGRAQAKVDRIDAQIAALRGEGGGQRKARGGGAGGGGVRKRAKNAMSLVESLAKTLKGKTMSVTDVSEAVQKAGYKTTAANFRTIVNQALIKFPRVFRKVARGQYTAH